MYIYMLTFISWNYYEVETESWRENFSEMLRKSASNFIIWIGFQRSHQIIKAVQSVYT